LHTDIHTCIIHTYIHATYIHTHAYILILFEVLAVADFFLGLIFIGAAYTHRLRAPKRLIRSDAIS
jgi:hypothetical protein